jgi:uncharacterized protein involved in exopolysaccharide biosynthesis
VALLSHGLLSSGGEGCNCEAIEMMPNEKMTSREGSIDLVYVFALLWRGKWLIAGTASVAVLLAVAYALTAPSWYRSEVLLKLAETRSTQGLSGQLGALGGLASLAGLTIGSNTSAEPIAVLTSREFIGDFIRDENLLPVLLADKWDASAKRWKPSRAGDEPDIRDGIRYFSKNVIKVTEDRKSSLITLTIEWKDAAIAAAWADVLVDRVNEHMRQRALREAQNNVGYLKQELASASLVAVQQSIGRVLETELQRLMLANVNKEYAFRVIDRAQIAKRRYYPQRALIVSGVLVASLILSALFLIALDAFRRSRAQFLAG